MNYNQKKLNIEENYLNGNISDARTLFLKCAKADRKEMIKDAAGVIYYTSDGLKAKAFQYLNFLVNSL